MPNQEVFWNFFQATGRIGAYLIFREISKDYRPVSNRIFRKKRKLE